MSQETGEPAANLGIVVGTQFYFADRSPGTLGTDGRIGGDLNDVDTLPTIIALTATSIGSRIRVINSPVTVVASPSDGVDLPHTAKIDPRINDVAGRTDPTVRVSEEAVVQILRDMEIESAIGTQ